MSILSQYQQKEKLLKQLQEELQALESNQEMQKALEFKEKLEQLMDTHDKTTDDVLDILDPDGKLSGRQEEKPKSGKGSRKARTIKVYQHPETGERVETAGGNNSVLKRWREDYTKEQIDKWIIETKEPA